MSVCSPDTRRKSENYFNVKIFALKRFKDLKFELNNFEWWLTSRSQNNQRTNNVSYSRFRIWLKVTEFHCGIKFLERIFLIILILLNQKRAKNRMKLFVAVGAIATPTLAGECASACTAEVLQSNIVNTGSRFVFVI